MTWAAVAGGTFALFMLLVAWPVLDARRDRRDADWHEQWRRRG